MKTHFLKLVLSIIIFQFLISISANANNVQVSNVVRTGQDIAFDLSWENSWNVQGQPSNHDAVWIFIKYKKCTETIWKHALLNTSMSSHSFGSAITYATPILETDRFGNGTGNNTGVMIKRSDIGIGHINTNNSISLNVVGPVAFDSDDYDIRVFAVEMVYIVEGEFIAGNLNSRDLKETGQDFLHIVNEDPINVTDNSYTLTLPADFPKGYNSFYIMKYEITQGQYVDFLNTLTAGDANRYYENSNYMHGFMSNTGTNGIVYSTTSADRSLNYMSIDDLFSYLDWAALRPLSELEYEKACRGFGPYNEDEYAWGSETGVKVFNVSGATAGIEVATDNPLPNCNIYYDPIQGGQFNGSMGPVAAGMFARTSNTRIGTGASFFGVMELSGNVEEPCLAIQDANSNDAPSSYTGQWGDGYLNASGLFNVSSWSSHYYFYKGGGWHDGWSYMRVSYRGGFYAMSSYHSSRSDDRGGRGCR